ncbi:MAG: aminodeoxychorismate synthase component I [Pseudomonadales bacterium]|nr:aminodeoxychorismate synthase component I [Pseudomonadales bacterium]
MRETPGQRESWADAATAGDGCSAPFVLLDDSSARDAMSLLYTDPVAIVRADTAGDVTGAVERIESAVANGLHAAGFASYELGYALEPRLAALMPQARSVPLLWFGLFAAPRRMRGADIADWLTERTRNASHGLGDVSLAWTREEYEQRFARALAMIRAGDIYQLNLTFKARFTLTGSPLALYRELRARQPVAHGALVDTGDVTMLSVSPELFVDVDERRLHMRPMKGTAARLPVVEADARQRLALVNDEKQRAENLMIVDLIRNDLGRIADIGSVRVDDLFTVETFSTLHQMTSGVSARLKAGIGLKAVLRGIFPSGSITGAPKIRAMEVIRELETEPRGVYCGAIGHVSPERRARFNVAIRTAVIQRDGQGEMGIGSGVVADSKVSGEYAECLLKMKFLRDSREPFLLIETMRYEPGKGIWLEARHYDRLRFSASWHAYALDEMRVREAVAAAIAPYADETLRVRLTLAKDGTPAVSTTVLGADAMQAVMRYVVSPTRLNSADPFLYHKTTRRELYEAEWRRYHDEAGADEVVYLNEVGDLAEGSRTNIFIVRGDVLLTPPVSAGLLPGTLRAELIATGRAREARLGLDDLTRAEICFLGNSVRGLVRAVPQAPGGSTSQHIDPD